jgi:hypothetical protein
MKDREEVACETKPGRKPYQPPRMTMLGTVRDLTLASTGKYVEVPRGNMSTQM